MKIYSWNMLFRNQELDRAFEFIRDSDFDLFCLQEVPEDFLARLKTLPFHIAEATDVERLFVLPQRLHLVVLSHYPIKSRGTIPFPEYWDVLPLRTRVFVHLMRPLHWTKIRNRSGLYIDVTTPDGVIRVFNLHTALTRPDLRMKEFELAMITHDPALPTIVCGDFNALESPRISILNWFLGGSFGSVFHYERERTTLEKHFVEHKLANPLRGLITHPFSQSQLDHILISHSLSLREASVLPDRIGSDHHPIRIEIA